jgi:hypothetical protein
VIWCLLVPLFAILVQNGATSCKCHHIGLEFQVFVWKGWAILSESHDQERALLFSMWATCAALGAWRGSKSWLWCNQRIVCPYELVFFVCEVNIAWCNILFSAIVRGDELCHVRLHGRDDSLLYCLCWCWEFRKKAPRQKVLFIVRCRPATKWWNNTLEIITLSENGVFTDFPFW